MDQDKSDHHFRKGKEQEAWKISKVETAKSQTLFPGNLLNYFFVVFAVMVTAQEFIRVARKEACLASRRIGRLTNQKLVASTVMALEFRAGLLISAGECEIGIIASETMPKIVVLCCASGAAMRIQSERRLL